MPQSYRHIKAFLLYVYSERLCAEQFSHAFLKAKKNLGNFYKVREQKQHLSILQTIDRVGAQPAPEAYRIGCCKHSFMLKEFQPIGLTGIQKSTVNALNNDDLQT